MKSDEKLKYIYNHTQELKEQVEIIQKSLKWISKNIKIIEKFSTYE